MVGLAQRKPQRTALALELAPALASAMRASAPVGRMVVAPLATAPSGQMAVESLAEALADPMAVRGWALAPPAAPTGQMAALALVAPGAARGA
jgi:hypothetical protein